MSANNQRVQRNFTIWHAVAVVLLRHPRPGVAGVSDIRVNNGATIAASQADEVMACAGDTVTFQPCNVQGLPVGDVVTFQVV